LKFKSFPFFRQLDVMDCGPAALKIVAKFYGKDFSIKFLRDKCNITREGVSIRDISRVAEEIGLKNLPIKLTLEDLISKIKLPCIIHWNYSHFVVLYRIKRNKVFISDPQLGLVEYTSDEFQYAWKRNNDKGVILIIETSPDFYEKSDVKSNISLSHYVKHVAPYRSFLIQIFIGMLIGIPLSLVFPFITQSIVDIGIETRDYDFINLLLVATVILTLSSALSGYIQSRMMLYVADRVNISMVSEFIRKILQLPITFYERKMTSDILNRIADHNRIQEFILNSFLGIIVGSISFVVYAVILIYYNATLFWFFILGTILYVLWILLFLKRRRTMDFKFFDSNILNQNEVIQISENSVEIKVNNLQQKKRWDWERSRLDIYDLNIKMLNLTQTQSIGTAIIDRLKNVFITFFAAKSVINGDMTFGMLLSSQYIIGQMNGPVSQVIGFIQSYQNANISLERVNEVVYDEKEEPISMGPEMEIPKEKNLKITALSFRYLTSGPHILKNISLEVPEGKMLAIVGPSGSGKTTLMKILLGLYTDYEGDITVGNTNLKSINIHKWRDECGAVLQEGRILDDTILRNIILEDERINTEKLNEVIQITNLGEFIDSTNLKLYTIIGRGGVGISGGQKQRVLIARALYKDPSFLFFDEATNSLDAKNEREITLNINLKYKGKTTIAIAHRLSTVKSADMIVVLRSGEIVEQGTHEELLKLNGFYQELVNNQLASD
jgi:ATP-binding cassette subfamily B protein